MPNRKPITSMADFDGGDYDEILAVPATNGKAQKKPAAPAPKKTAKKKTAAAPKMPVAKPAASSEPVAPRQVGAKGGERVQTGKAVSLDERKLSKKDRERLLQGWQGSNRGKALDTYFARHVENARSKFGHHAVYLGDEADRLIICLPVPSLPIEFLLATNGWPLGLIIQVVGKSSVDKSGFLAEIGRWFDLAGGGLNLNENESKFNPKWYRSILGPAAYGRMPLHRCGCLEDWQEHLTWSVADAKQYFTGTDKNPGPGRTVPIAFGVDTIMGKSSREVQDKILGKKTKSGLRGFTGEGSAGRGHPIESMSITRYLRSFPQELNGWPFSLILLNHLKMGKDDDGRDERNKAGGKGVDFQESYELEIKRWGGKHRIRSLEEEGFTVSLSCEKNSFGYDHRSIRARVMWTEVEDPETGDWDQLTWWDWDWALVDLLNTILTDVRREDYKRLRDNLNNSGFHLSCPSTAEIKNMAWSRNLGMREKDALPWRELGKLIHADTELREQLRTALRINRRPYLAGDYLQQLNTMAQKVS